MAVVQTESVLLSLIEENQWDEFQPLMDHLAAWDGYPLVLRRLETLDRAALFASAVHGVGHIERVILHGGFCAMEDALSAEDVALLLDVCAYHDVGRRSDGPDPEHGARSARRLASLTGRSGRPLALIQAAADAHARPEEQMADVLAHHGFRGDAQALSLTQLLKDADGLDRVRIGDLDPRMLRREASRTRVPFAEALFFRYQAALGLPPKPFFSKAQREAMRASAVHEETEP